MFAGEVPGNAVLVVHTKQRMKISYRLLLSALVLQFANLAGEFAFFDRDQRPLLLLMATLFALQVICLVLVLREFRALFGPQLAADHTAVWVRTGLGKHPQVVYLPWQAIDGIDVAGKRPALRIMSRQGEDLLGERVNWRLRSMRRRVGTAFAVDGRITIEHSQQLAYRLHQLGMWAAHR